MGGFQVFGRIEIKETFNQTEVMETADSGGFAGDGSGGFIPLAKIDEEFFYDSRLDLFQIGEPFGFKEKTVLLQVGTVGAEGGGG